MSISYIITNKEELKELEELGFLKNEIEKQRLRKKQGKQDQNYLLVKHFSPITKAIKDSKLSSKQTPEENWLPPKKNLKKLKNKK